MVVLFLLAVLVLALTNSNSGKEFFWNLAWYGFLLGCVLAFVSVATASA